MVRWSIFICVLSAFDLCNYLFAYCLMQKYREVYFKDKGDILELKHLYYNIIENGIDSSAFTLG